MGISRSSSRAPPVVGFDWAGIALFFAILGITASIASIFLAGLWKDDLRQRLGFSDETMDTMDFLLDFSNFFAMLPGYVVDRFGPTSVVFGSALLHFIGYGSLFLTVIGAIPPQIAFVSMIFVGQGAIWIVMSSLGVLGKLVKEADKGKAVGLAMTWFSIAPVAVHRTATVLLGSSALTPAFYAICGGIMAGVGVVGGIVMVVSPWRDNGRREGKSIGMWFAIVFTLFVSVTPLIDVSGSETEYVSVVWIPFCVLVGLSFSITGRCVRETRLEARGLVSPPSPRTASPADGESVEAPDTNLILSEVSLSAPVNAALAQFRYWSVFSMLGLLCGGGMAISNHVSSLAKGVGWDTQQAVALFATGNSLSRLFIGCFSDVVSRSISRSTLLTLFTWVMCIVFALLTFAPHNAALVKIGVVVGGFCFGTPWMLVPAIEMEWYGHENFGSIHGVMMLAADFGVILVRVFSAVFDGLTPVFAILMGVHIAAAFFATTGTLTGQMSKGVMMFPAKNDAGEHLKDDTVDNSPNCQTDSELVASAAPS